METKRLVNVGAETLMGVKNDVLDKGYITLVDYMGTDETVVAAARHSYDKGLNQDDHVGNERLIHFLMRGRHTSPFEQPAMVFEVKAPIFVFREWHRHRTAKLNEMSGRYTVLPEEFYVPSLDRIQAQSKMNKQGSGEALDKYTQKDTLYSIADTNRLAFQHYNLMLNDGVAKEIARIVLPVNTYSKMVWQCDLHNLLHFLKLRMDSAAQFEIRQYANEIGNMVEKSFPKVWEAFEEYVLYSKSLSLSERQALSDFLQSGMVLQTDMLKLLDKINVKYV